MRPGSLPNESRHHFVPGSRHSKVIATKTPILLRLVADLMVLADFSMKESKNYVVAVSALRYDSKAAMIIASPVDVSEEGDLQGRITGSPHLMTPSKRLKVRPGSRGQPAYLPRGFQMYLGVSSFVNALLRHLSFFDKELS